MEFNKACYATGKLVRIFPSDTHWKEGYIRNVDDLGWTYEVTRAERECDLGVYFRNHASTFSFQYLD